MQPAEFLVIDVSGARSARAPATWGQLTLRSWDSMVTDEAHFVQGMVFGLPGDTTSARVRAALAHVLVRYDALRTLLVPDGDGLWQLVEGSGEMRVPVYCAVADGEKSAGHVAWSIAQTLAQDMQQVAFAHEKEWPVRFAVVQADGVPTQLVFVRDQIAIDGHGAETLIRDLLGTCAGETAIPAPHWQPVDEAGFEQSAQGQALTARAGQYWRDTLAAAPATMFDFPPLPAGEPRYFFYELRSAAIKCALANVRRRKFSRSAVIVAAMAVALSQYTGHDRIVMRLISGNRVGRDRKTMVGTLVTEGVLTLEVAGRSFDEIAVSAFKASGRGNQFAFCDPGTVAAVWHEQEIAQGAHIDLGACFSDVQGGFAEPRPGGEDAPEVDEAYLRELARSTTVHDSAGGSGVHGLRFFMAAVEAGPQTLLRLSADTAYVPQSAMHGILAGVERLLLAVATRELGAADLAAVTGIGPVARDGWARCGPGWLDLEATRQLWAQVAGARPATVLVEPAGGGTRLVGYLAGPAEPDFRALHRSFVAALGERNEVRAPQLYRLTANAPAAGADPADPAAWRDLPVLAEADGR